MGILEDSESLFEQAGFHLSQRCCVRPSCFDFVARKEKRIAFVKVYSNIGNVYEKDARGLATLAKLFYGSSMLICEKTRDKTLEDDTVYSRFGVGAFTLKTLEDSLLNDTGPLIEAGPGGYYVQLDGDAMKKKRLEKGLSIGKMAELMGVSRRTLYGYERGMAKASVSAACKLEQGLGIPIVKPMDVFQLPREIDGFFAAARRMIAETRLMQFVVRKLLQINFAVFQVGRAPFDFVAKAPKDGTSILGAVVKEKEPNLETRSEEIISVSKIVEAQPIFVTSSRRVSVEHLPLLRLEDFEGVKCCEDLFAKL
jgi:putative transcriptional regulator